TGRTDDRHLEFAAYRTTGIEPLGRDFSRRLACPLCFDILSASKTRSKNDAPRIVKDRRFAFWAFAVAAALLIADTAWFGLLRDFDNGIADSLVRLAARSHPADPDIVMLVADERSIAVLGEEVDRWPWPREVFGVVARAIAAQKP